MYVKNYNSQEWMKGKFNSKWIKTRYYKILRKKHINLYDLGIVMAFYMLQVRSRIPPGLGDSLMV